MTLPDGQLKDKILVWMDLEMTGLNPAHDKIIEIATIATDWQLNVISEGPELAIHWPKELFDGMDQWCVDHHGASGLTQRCLNTQTTLAQAEAETLTWVKSLITKGESPLCGNSIHQDRRFLVGQMPELEEYFHYRNIDVSTVKELARRWYPELPSFKKAGKHTALEDIRESIDELKHYQEKIFLP